MLCLLTLARYTVTEENMHKFLLGAIVMNFHFNTDLEVSFMFRVRRSKMTLARAEMEAELWAKGKRELRV